jgi:antitoxin PrlF
MSVLEIEAAITERGQTTVPAAIRKALGVGKRGTVVFRLSKDGRVTLELKGDGQDPVVGKFLEFLANDMLNNPAASRPISAEWLAYAKKLVAGVEIDLDQPLSDDGE